MVCVLWAVGIGRGVAGGRGLMRGRGSIAVLARGGLVGQGRGDGLVAGVARGFGRARVGVADVAGHGERVVGGSGVCCGREREMVWRAGGVAVELGAERRLGRLLLVGVGVVLLVRVVRS